MVEPVDAGLPEHPHTGSESCPQSREGVAVQRLDRAILLDCDFSWCRVYLAADEPESAREREKGFIYPQYLARVGSNLYPVL